MPDPLSILYMQTNGAVGGTERMNFRTWQALQKRGHQIDIVILDDDDASPMAVAYAAAGQPAICLAGRRKSWLGLRYDLAAILQKRRYDIVHLFGMRVNLLSRGLIHGSAIVCGQRSGAQSWRHAWLERLTNRPVHLYISNSHAGTNWLQQTVGIEPARCKTIHSGLDPAHYNQQTRTTARAAHNLPDNLPVLIHIANLRPVKDQRTLLQAAALLHESGTAFQLWLVGSGPEEKRLHRLAQAFGLGDTIRFLGHRDDIPTLLSAADICLLTSRNEGLPGVILEAMASGLPVVATSVGGIPEVVRHGETGLLAPAGAPQQIAAHLAALITSPQLRRRMGQAGHRRFLSHFRLTDKIDELEATYLSLRQ